MAKGLPQTLLEKFTALPTAGLPSWRREAGCLLPEKLCYCKY